MPKATLAKLGKDKALLKSVLLYHVVKGNVPASKVVTLNGKSAKTVNGAGVKIAVKGGKVYLNGSTLVTKTDVKASNGTIHVINKVLLPPAKLTSSAAKPLNSGRERLQPLPRVSLVSTRRGTPCRAAPRARASRSSLASETTSASIGPYVATSSQTVRSVISPTRTRALSACVPGSVAIAARRASRASSIGVSIETGNWAEISRRGSLIVRLTILLVVSWVFGMKTRRASSVTSVV